MLTIFIIPYCVWSFIITATPGRKGYKKTVLRKGDKINFPKKGDTVSVRYTGKLENGQVFDTNVGGKKKSPPLKFKVGQGLCVCHTIASIPFLSPRIHHLFAGKVIKGWDEGLLEMSVGEKATLTIEPEWAYGAKGLNKHSLHVVSCNYSNVSLDQRLSSVSVSHA